MDAKELKKYSIYVTKHGSHAYGLNTPSSDLDIKGVFMTTPEYQMGFLHKAEQIEEKTPNDLVIYELSKFFRLAADCNPNIIEVLWTEEKDIIYINEFGRQLRDASEAFLSQKARFTFSGYAISQLKRMVGHHEWIVNPPKPPRDRINIPGIGMKPSSWCDYLIDRQGNPVIDKNSGRPMIEFASEQELENLETEKEWRKEVEKWRHYQEWLNNRNPKRHELEAKYGYDTKHGMHLVRLLRMGYEIITTGKVIVKRPDREELLAIRNNGIWSYEQIVEYAEKMEKSLDDFYKSDKSPLPKSPDLKKLNRLCVLMYRDSTLFNINTPLPSPHSPFTWNGAV